MERHIRLRTVKRKHLDEDKLALALLLLAKSIVADQSNGEEQSEPDKPAEAA